MEYIDSLKTGIDPFGEDSTIRVGGIHDVEGIRTRSIGFVITKIPHTESLLYMGKLVKQVKRILEYKKYALMFVDAHRLYHLMEYAKAQDFVFCGYIYSISSGSTKLFEIRDHVSVGALLYKLPKDKIPDIRERRYPNYVIDHYGLEHTSVKSCVECAMSFTTILSSEEDMILDPTCADPTILLGVRWANRAFTGIALNGTLKGNVERMLINNNSIKRNPITGQRKLF